MLWDDRRHFYWNEACRKYTAEQWGLAVKEVADLGMEYLVLLAIAKGGKAFYDTPVLPKAELACDDPIGAMLAAADRYGVKFFISSDWYGEWDNATLLDPKLTRIRYQMMGEVAQRYGHHQSFLRLVLAERGLHPALFRRAVRQVHQRRQRRSPKAHAEGQNPRRPVRHESGGLRRSVRQAARRA